MFSNAPISGFAFSTTADVLAWSFTTDGADTAAAVVYVSILLTSAVTEGTDIYANFGDTLWNNIDTPTGAWQAISPGAGSSWADVNSTTSSTWQTIAA